MFNTLPLHKHFPTPLLTPVSDTSDFTPTGYIEITNSGKTAKSYVYENGKHCFIRQAPHRNLRALLNSQSLKDEKCKYQKTNKGENK
ncbi:MAG: hypothetical protein FWF27_04920 [Candidatus Bathyarchaeota archaeon]|nr:hypothetical protein [Candidatus Termiticorpusculum sp.]